MVAEGPGDEAVVGGVGAGGAVDVDEVLEPVDRQVGQPQLPALGHAAEGGLVEVDVAPQPDLVGVVEARHPDHGGPVVGGAPDGRHEPGHQGSVVGLTRRR